MKNSISRKNLNPTLPYVLPAVLLAGLVLTACVGPRAQTPVLETADVRAERIKQEDLELKNRIDERTRLSAVTWRLQTANAPLCSATGYGIGALFTVPSNWEEHERAVWARRFRLSQTPLVIGIAPESPAAGAGLQQGDSIVSVNGRPAAAVSEDKWQGQLRGLISSDRPVTLIIDRPGADNNAADRMTLTPTPVAVCDYAVIHKQDSDINAYADGEKVILTSGIMDFTENDDELALVIGHEMAHNHMDHISAQRTNAAVGTVGGAIVDVLFAAAGVNTGGAFTQMGQGIGGLTYSVEFEQEADYIGMYFADRAGYDTSKTPDFWRRMAVEDSDAITHRTTHPTSPERFVALEKTREEITRKKETGAALIPNLKEN